MLLYDFVYGFFFLGCKNICYFFTELVPLSFATNDCTSRLISNYFRKLFLTRSISILVASLKFDLNFSCKQVNSVNNSFSSLRFCLPFILAKIIVAALISILIISQSNPLSSSSWYFETDSGICFFFYQFDVFLVC